MKLLFAPAPGLITPSTSRDYPEIIRQAGVQGVDILLSPAYVWPEVAAIHAQMATFRSIENGMTVVRASAGGYSLISDPYGRVVVWEGHESNSMMAAALSLLRERSIRSWATQ